MIQLTLKPSIDLCKETAGRGERFRGSRTWKSKCFSFSPSSSLRCHCEYFRNFHFSPQICRFMMPMLVSKVFSGFKCFKTCQHEPEYSISAIAKIFAAFKVFLIQATSMMYVGLTMTSAAQFQMLRGKLFCYLFSVALWSPLKKHFHSII